MTQLDYPRLFASDPETITRTLRTVMPQIEEALMKGCAVSINHQTVRVRRLPIQ